MLNGDAKTWEAPLVRRGGCPGESRPQVVQRVQADARWPWPSCTEEPASTGSILFSKVEMALEFMVITRIARFRKQKCTYCRGHLHTKKLSEFTI